LVFEEIIVNQFLQSFSAPLLDLFFKAITYFGHPAPWIIIAAWLFWIGKEKKSLMVASIILFSGVVTGALKMVIARPRPEGILILEHDAYGYSMPSGHSTLAAAMYSFFEKKVKPYERALFLALVLLTVISRMYLGVHYLTDVLAGLLLGYLIGKAALAFEKRIEKSRLHITKAKEELGIILVLAAAVALLFVLPEELVLAQALLGYFLGFALHRHLKKNNPKNKKAVLVSGTIILGAIFGVAYLNSGAAQQLALFLGGLFITTWPAACARLRL